MANGSGLGPVRVVRMRKEDKVSACGRTRKGGWSMQVRCAPWIPWERSGGVFLRCQGIALYFEYLCLLSRCCASLCEAAFPRDLLTGPLMQKTQVVFPALSIQRSPLRPSHTGAHLGWLACKLFGARLTPLCALAEPSAQWFPCACFLPPCQGWQGRLRRRGNVPRAHQPLTQDLKTSCWHLGSARCREGCSSASALA